MEDKENEEFKRRIIELVKNVEKKDEDSNVAEQDVIDAKNRVLQTAKRRTQEEKFRSEFILVALTYWIQSLYKYRPEKYQEEIDELYNIIYQQLKKPNFYIPYKLQIADKRRILNNMKKVLGEGEINRFKEKYNLSELISSVQESKQRDPNSWWERTKLNLPIAIGLAVWTIIFSIMLFNSRFATESLFSSLIFTSLIVGVPTVIIELVFVYVVKVVKMKPKSSYDIGNINDYISLQERFRSGNYEYKTIKSKEDILKAYELGKKIVFTARWSSERLNFLIGSIITIPGIVGAFVLVIVFSSLNFPLDTIVYTFLFMFFLFFGLGSTIFFIPAIFRSRRLPQSFFILAPEGIVYRRTWSGVMSYSWKELDLRIYSVKTTIYGPLFSKMELPGGPQLHIILSNGSRLRFKPYDYNLDEFGSYEKLSGYVTSPILLVIMAFKYYFDAAKSA